MSSKPKLKIDWATKKAAKHACEKWHYSGTLPPIKVVAIGAWENDKFIGVVTFGLGSGNCTRGDRYGLAKTHEIAELTRVALRKHETPTSRIVNIAVKMFHKQSPGIKMLISFADESAQNHHGGIYQAMNWIYLGSFDAEAEFMINGKRWHSRSVWNQGWGQSLCWLQEHVDPNAYRVRTKKHRYVWPFDKDLRRNLEKQAKPYPKRPKQATAGSPSTRRGSTDPDAPKQKRKHGKKSKANSPKANRGKSGPPADQQERAARGRRKANGAGASVHGSQA